MTYKISFTFIFFVPKFRIDFKFVKRISFYRYYRKNAAKVHQQEMFVNYTYNIFPVPKPNQNEIINITIDVMKVNLVQEQQQKKKKNKNGFMFYEKSFQVANTTPAANILYQSHLFKIFIDPDEILVIDVINLECIHGEKIKKKPLLPFEWKIANSECLKC